MKKRILSMMLVLCMVLGMMPVSAFAAETDNLCDHHTEHTADCGYAAAVEGSPCTHECGEECAEACGHVHDELCGYVEAAAEVPCGYVCEESHEEEPSDEPAEEPVEEPAPVCDCGTENAAIHATTCAVYVAPENPVCYCTEKCTEVNEWCDVCGFDYSKCGITDSAVDYADEDYTYDEATNTYTVRTADALNTAISNAGTSGTTDNPAIIKLAADVEVAGTPNEYGDVEQALLVDNGVITLDLNGHTITSTGEAYYVIQVDNGATLTIDDSSEGNQGKIKAVHTAVQCYDGELVINGGTFEGVDSVSGWNDVTIIINGGTFIATQNAILAGNSVLTITGGTFTGGRSALSLTEWGTYSITGGSFSGEKYDIDTCGTTRFLSYNEGTGVGPTFPGGLSIWTNEYTGLNLNALLAEYAAYYDANVEKIELDDSAASYDGDVTVECEHLAEENADTNCQGSPCKYCGRYFGDKNLNIHVSDEFTYTPNAEDSSKHDKKYVCCGTVDVTEDHTGGMATCTTLAVCDTCGASYGEMNANNHNWENGVCTYECGTTHDPHTFENGSCTVCGMSEGPVELAITQQPTDSEAKLGETYCVEVIAQGEGLKYQWYFKNAGSEQWHKSGVTDNTYDDVMTTARAGREVYCVITDSNGNSVTTDTAKLIAVPSQELAITGQPNDASSKLNEEICVTVEAVGDGLKYQWYWRDVGSENWNVSGERDNTYDAVMTRARHNREVKCVITDLWGKTVETEIATITGTVTVPLEITRQPESQTVMLGEMFNVTFDAQGDDLRYQWYFRQAGTEAWYTSSQKDNSYDDVMTKPRHDRELYCVVTDAWGNQVATEPVVTILATPKYELAITAEPEDTTAKLGEEFCVTVEAQGDELKYQWYWRNVGSENWNVSSERDNTYDAVMTKARHNREVKCVITDLWGKTVETGVATITATPSAVLAIVTQPTDAAAAMGENYCAAVEAQGDGLTYQWYFKNAGSDVWHTSGVKDNTYDDVMTTARADRQVYCVITDLWGNTVTSDTVTLVCS